MAFTIWVMFFTSPLAVSSNIFSWTTGDGLTGLSFEDTEKKCQSLHVYMSTTDKHTLQCRVRDSRVGGLLEDLKIIPYHCSFFGRAGDRREGHVGTDNSASVPHSK